MTVRELARWLQVSEWKARELAKDPSFPSFKVGGRHRFWRSAVHAHLSQPCDPWKQSPQSLGRRRKREAGAAAQLWRVRS